MIARIWRTRFDLNEKAKLVAYAHEVSLPVLSTREGIVHVLFLTDRDEWITMTIWTDQAAIDLLEDDPDYSRIVDGINALGVLRGAASLEIFDYRGGTVSLPFADSSI